MNGKRLAPAWRDGWVWFRAAFAFVMTVFVSFVFVVRMLWYDLGQELLKIFGTPFPWFQTVFGLAFASLAWALALLINRVVARRDAQTGRPHLVTVILPVLLSAGWMGLLVHLLLGMNNERNLVPYVLADSLPWSVPLLGLVLVWAVPLFRVRPGDRLRPKAASVRIGATAMFLAFALGRGLADRPFAGDTIAGPWLQNLDGSHATVVWITSKGSRGWVEFGEGGTLSRRAQGELRGLVDAGGIIQKVRLEGLEPGREYRYRTVTREVLRIDPIHVDFGATVRGPLLAFRTPGADEERVEALVWNDIHEQEGSIYSMYSRLGARPDLLVYNGDMVNHLDSPRQVAGELFVPAARLSEGGFPVVFVRGNHETRGPVARRLQDWIDAPGGEFYYAFTRGPVRFIVLDSGESGADDWHENSGLTDFKAYHLRQAEWLRREVAGPAFAEAGYRVVFVHIPIDPASDRGKPHESDSYRSEIGRILEEAGASLMVAGHTHMPALREPVPGKRGFPIMTGGDWNMARGNASTIRLRADAKCLIAELFLFGKEGDGRLARRIEIAPTRRLRTMVRAGDQAERDMGDAGGAADRSACR